MSQTAYNNLSCMLLLSKMNPDCNLNNFKKQRLHRNYIYRNNKDISTCSNWYTVEGHIGLGIVSHPFNLEFHRRYF